MCSPSAPAPSSSTSVMDLPDWAKGYAKDTLAKTAALTDISQNPYQTYKGERIAGTQPLQQQAFTSAAGMNAGPEGFAKDIGAYMSPYMQNVVDIEKREAARQSGIAGTQQQAQATQAGAFGGGRDAIMRAERERNLAQQMGDIQSKGSQAAFEQGANQFRQGIQQQGAITQLQSSLGQLQQQQAQRPLDVAYQDFISQQNYPYKQLGYMSDMIRGLPLGQKSTAQTYEAPGSTLGQLAGLGVGIGGMSKLFAEGGLAFADGGVTSPQNIEAILAKLSDAQLKQAYQAALDRRDVNEAQMIEAVMAERASMRRGTQEPFSGIAPALPEQFADQMEQNMATGGIVAFADRGAVVEEEASSPFQDFLNKLARSINPAISGSKAEYESKQAIMDKAKELRDQEPGFFTVMKPSEREAKLKEIEQQRKALSGINEKVSAGDYKATEPLKSKPAAQPAPATDVPPIKMEQPAPQKPAAKPLDKQFADITSAPKPSKAQVKSAVEQLAKQQNLNPDIKDDLMANAMAIRKQLGSENQPIIDEMKKMIEGQKPDVEAMKSQGLNQGLAEFGFKMAANAARPGARFLESASTAAPALSTAAAKTQELITAAQQNYAKLRMDQAKYETALQKNDMQTAATMAASIRQGQQQDKLLQFHIANAKDQLEMEKQKLASQSSYQQGILARQPDTVLGLTRNIMQNEGLPYDKALEKAGNIMKGGIPAGMRAEGAASVQLQKDIDKIDDFYRPLMAFTKDPAKLAELQTKRDAEVRAKMQSQTRGVQAPGAAPSAGGGKIMNFDSQGNPI